MEDVKIIEFQRTRDFSNKLNATFTFVRQNFKGLFRSMLYIAGPPVLVASLLLSSFVGDFFKLVMGAGRDPEAFQNFFLTVSFWIQAALMFVFVIVSYVAVIATTNCYMILYAEKRTADLEVNDVWEKVRETLGMYLATTLLFGLVTVLMYLFMLIPIVLLGNISGFLIFFGVIFLIVGVFYVFIGASLIYPIRAFEKKGFFEALARSFYLIRGKWWSTFGLLMILSLLVGIISYVFSIPASILQGVSMLHQVKPDAFNESSGITESIVFILNALAYITQLLLYLLPNVGLAFQYFNLVEMKEAKGLMGQINTLGETQDAPRPEEHY